MNTLAERDRERESDDPESIRISCFLRVNNDFF